MFSLTIFAEEMLISQQKGMLTDYCLEHWDEALESLPGKHLDMEVLVEMASGVNVISKVRNTILATDTSLKYWQFVESLKAGES